jgi:hypothetical protein
MLSFTEIRSRRERTYVGTTWTRSCFRVAESTSFTSFLVCMGPSR